MLGFISFSIKIIFASIIGGAMNYIPSESKNNQNIIETCLICVFSASILALARQFSDRGEYFAMGFGILAVVFAVNSISKNNENILIGGDFNIIPAAEDVHNPKGYEDDALFRLEVRKKLREIINLGFHDAYRYINADKEGYTFWDYMSGAWQKNNGMRIDHFLVSNSLINIVKNVKINKHPRGRVKPSDHTPIEIELA